MQLSYFYFFWYRHLPDCRDTFEDFLVLASADMRHMRYSDPDMFCKVVDNLWSVRYCNDYRVEV